MIVPDPSSYLKTFALIFVAGFLSSSGLSAYTKWVIKRNQSK